MEADEAKLRDELNKLVDRYKRQVDSKGSDDDKLVSREYTIFRDEFMPKPLSVYEDLCKKAGEILRFKPDEKTSRQLEESIRISHLDITPTGAHSLAILAPLALLALGILLGLGLMGSMFAMFFFLVAATFMMFILQKLPEFVANKWRMEASNQMVVCVFYIATYMRHTPNLENAIEFAADHVSPPLALDLKKVLWDVETEKYPTIKESLDSYLETWRKWNLEFIESFHLIEASLYEKGEERRLILIDKALDVILQETYEKMLHYAYNLKNPITMLHMLGVILPILGLVILPLVVSFMGNVKWYQIALLYNFILPVMVYFLGMNIMSTRPTGYGDTDISEDNPELKKYKNLIINLGFTELRISPLAVAVLVAGIFLLVGLTPLMVHSFAPGAEAGISKVIMEYKANEAGEKIGPFGVGSAVISLFVVLGLGLGIATYFSLRSKNVIKIREDSKELEKEFASGLFQLGNRIGDGVPAEMAFGSVAKVMQDTRSGDFFSIVNNNITKLGMNIETALFNKKNGALVFYPSRVIESSMKVLLQSSQKGPLVCSQALITISQYIKEIHRVDERLKDLLAEIIASMKSQISFMAPAIAGIVVGITSMINTIMGSLTTQIENIGENAIGAGEAGVGASLDIPVMFKEGIPTYFFQIVVGVYVIQIVYILTVLSNGIENGSDKLSEEYLVGRNMRNSTILYCVLAGIVMIVFNTIATQILPVLNKMP
ncbi:MAG: hypothetical protein WC749_11940 [Dehalococcoidia bacterium]